MNSYASERASSAGSFNIATNQVADGLVGPFDLLYPSPQQLHGDPDNVRHLSKLSAYYDQFLARYEEGGNFGPTHIEFIKKDVDYLISEMDQLLRNASAVRQSCNKRGVCPFGTTPHCIPSYSWAS